MRLQEDYSFTNKRQVWRLVPAGKNLIIEEREPHTKEVFFNCINLETGEVIFRNFQLEEKFWIGVEVVYKDIIYFHKFGKPDMPGHKEIIAVDLYTLQVIWTSTFTFLNALDDKVYSFINLFEGREYYLMNYKTGEVLETLSDKDVNVNELRGKSFDNEFYHDSYFPEKCKPGDPLIQKVIEGKAVPGTEECILVNGYLLLSYHIEILQGELRNIFCIVEIDSENIIFKDILNQKTQKIIPENFFVKGKKIILIKEKSVLQVYSLK